MRATKDGAWELHVGAIPSAIGGRTIGLSHIGCAFLPEGDNLVRWRGWMRHIQRDQGIWVFASILGMALPCMMSLEFIRNATVTGDRVAAMAAGGNRRSLSQFRVDLLDHDPIVWFPGSGSGPGERRRPDRPALD